MSAQFFPKLSQNYIEILEDNEYYDITIEVGEDPNVKIFRSHMNILCYRSPFLRRTMASEKAKSEGTLTHIKLPKISPEIFQILLRYIYGGVISLNEQHISDILHILAAADQLLLQELVEYLQNYLIENKSGLIDKHFELTCQISFQSNSLSELQQLCTDIIAKSPDKIFKSLDFTTIPEKSLISLIKRDDLQMKEVDIWDHVLRWGLDKNPTLIPDPFTWTDNDFKIMRNTLQNILPLIRFYSLSSDEFTQKVRPYRKLLKYQLYENLLSSYLDSNSEPGDDILLPRQKNIDGIINSKIVNLNLVSVISRWIDKIDTKSKFAHARELYLPYEFKLLLRGSRDGLTPKKFHDLCDNVPYTVTFIKVKGTEQILGGYNPLIWKHSYEMAQTKYSFIFSFKGKNNFEGSILSYVNNTENALYYGPLCGPSFGNDLRLANNLLAFVDYNNNSCKQCDYEKKIRDSEENFSIEDYEVFQILKNKKK